MAPSSFQPPPPPHHFPSDFPLDSAARLREYLAGAPLPPPPPPPQIRRGEAPSAPVNSARLLAILVHARRHFPCLPPATKRVGQARPEVTGAPPHSFRRSRPFQEERLDSDATIASSMPRHTSPCPRRPRRPPEHRPRPRPIAAPPSSPSPARSAATVRPSPPDCPI